MDPRLPSFGAPAGGDGPPGAAQRDAFWRAAALLYANWKRIALFTFVVAVLAVGVALVVPRDYAAEARVLKNEDTTMSSLIGLTTRSMGGVGRLLGSSSSDFSRYLAILHSRSLRERLVQEFDLVAAYEVGGRPHPMEAALQKLDKNLAFEVSSSYDYLSVLTFDRDPERAERMANFLVDELNRRHVQLTSESARQTRLFVEQRLNEARAELDSVGVAIQLFQERHGVVELGAQAESFLRAAAEQSGRTAQLEVQYQTLLSQYGPENPQVRAAQQALGAARAQQQRAIGGGEALMPVALRDMPSLAREYAALAQEQLIQVEILQTVYPLYEQARFQERNEAQAVQVLDRAAASVRPVRPKRSLIVLIATLTGTFLACVFVLGNAWLRDNHAALAGRLREAPRPLRSGASA